MLEQPGDVRRRRADQDDDRPSDPQHGVPRAQHGLILPRRGGREPVPALAGSPHRLRILTGVAYITLTLAVIVMAAAGALTHGLASAFWVLAAGRGGADLPFHSRPGRAPGREAA
jgi:hypothetical protein